MPVPRTVLDRPVTPKGLLPTVSGRSLGVRPMLAGRQLAASGLAGPVLNFCGTNGWAGVPGTWTTGVSTDSATFEIWIRTTRTARQTLFIGSNEAGGLPIIGVGGDQIWVYWEPIGPGWLASADTTPVTDGQWHHIAVVFDGGAITFYKDGIATADRLTVSSAQQAGGNLQLGAGFGESTGFVGQLSGARVWSVARAAPDIATSRWATLDGETAGLTVQATWDQGSQQTTNQVGGGTSGIENGSVITTDLPAPNCALSFDGTGAAAWGDGTVAIIDNDVVSTAATFECWLRIDPAQAATSMTIWSVNWPANPALTLRVEYAGGNQLAVFWGGQQVTSADTSVIADGTWHHVAVGFDHNYVRFYKDGVVTADQLQFTGTQTAEGLVAIGAATGGPGDFTGAVTDVRFWSVSRSLADICAFRFLRLPPGKGTPGLVFLCNFTSVQLSDPTTPPIDEVLGLQGQLSGGAAVVATAPPTPPMPQQVWTYPTTGISPVGPVLGGGAVLGLDTTSGSALLRSIDPLSGTQNWSYDVTAHSALGAVAVPAAITSAGGVVYLGVQAPSPASSQTQVQAVDAATGAPVWSSPAVVQGGSQICTRPVVLSGTLFVGVDAGSGALAWGDPTTGRLTINFRFGEFVGFMTDPVIDAANVYVGTVSDSAVLVTAVSVTSIDGTTAFAWQKSLTEEITADLVLADGTLYVAGGGTVLALNTADGSQAWSTPVSTAQIVGRPVVIDTTLYVAAHDGTLYALDAGSGAVQWQVDTGSPITTDLINQNGVLYFANAGDGADLPPAFCAVDTLSLGADVLSYAVPAADTILFGQGGALDGTVYFYGSQDIYAVNMSTVVREFSVSTKLLVESYDTTTISRSDGQPTGSDTSYRVSIVVRDENGVARTQYPVKVWAAGTVYVTNQGPAPVPLSATEQAWMNTDASGTLTLAVSAYDIGTPESGTPNLACPAIILWAPFMAVGETVVVYPDHESLANLAAVQGTTPATGTAAAGTLYLDAATGYDGTAMISSDYNDPTSLDNIASAVRNTVGARNPATAAAVHLAGHHGANRYVREGLLSNVVYSADPSSTTTRQWYPGEFGTFTTTIGTTAAGFTPNQFDDSLIDPKLSDPLTDIGDFVKNVIHGAEKVAKLAWKFTENAVNTVIQTATNVYKLTITALEDAVTAVAGFLKSVVNDIKKAIEWLSALFDWKNILANHTYLKNAITNSARTGAVDRIGSWLTAELNGGTDASGLLSSLKGQGSTNMDAAGQSAAGQTVGSNQVGGTNDPNTVYNHGGHNNASQCTWMHQKVMENSAGATVGDSLTTIGGPDPFGDALATWFTALGKALVGDLEDLPDRVHAQVRAANSHFKDPHSLVSAGISDIIGVFVALGDELIDFAGAVLADTLVFLNSMLDGLFAWLASPIHIPFVSDLYKLITGDQLSILDLICLIGAVPGTILLTVLTGSPTVPADSEAVGPTGAIKPGDKAGILLFGIVGFAVGELGCLLDILTTDWSAEQPSWYTAPAEMPVTVSKLLTQIDIACDSSAWAFGFAGSVLLAQSSGNPMKTQDYLFQVFQVVPVAATACMALQKAGYAGKDQCANDVFMGVLELIVASIFAGIWPSDYRDAGKVPGLVLVANLLGAASSICEGVLLVGDPSDPDLQLAEAVAKGALHTYGAVASFAGSVLAVTE